MRAVWDCVWFPGRKSLWTSDWTAMLGVVITADDVRYWPYSLCLLVKVKGNADWRSHVGKGVQRRATSRTVKVLALARGKCFFIAKCFHLDCLSGLPHE